MWISLIHIFNLIEVFLLFFPRLFVFLVCNFLLLVWLVVVESTEVKKNIVEKE
jgi:hypothetical protein